MRWRLAGVGDLPAVRDALASAPRVGIDTEFHAERRYLPQLYLVQLKFPDGTIWVLDPLDAASLEVIAEGLGRPDWVLHGGQQDLRVLTPLCGRPARVWDTQVAAALLGHRYPAAYSELISAELGHDVEKGETLSDWSRRPLHPEQLLYAATDVEDLVRLWDTLAEKVGALDRLPLLADACDEIAAQALVPQAPDWRRLTGTSALDPRSAAALDLLLTWREGVAALLDQPARQIVPDPVLTDLARRLPRTRGALAANRRLAKGLIRDFCDDILTAIHQALELPDGALPPVIRIGSNEAGRVSVLAAAADLLGARYRWAPGLVLPRAILERLALTAPLERAAIAAALGSWRDRLAGDALHAFFNGSTAIRWNAGGPELG